MNNKKRWLDGYFILAVLLVVCDQVTKVLAKNALEGQDSYQVIPGIFEFSYLENTGAAFGSFSGNILALSAVTVLLLAAVIWKYRDIPREPRYRVMRIIFAMVFAGGIGNLIDRIFRGYVIDFLYFVPIDFPKFNLADTFITVGAAAFIVAALTLYRGNGLDFLWQVKQGQKDQQNHRQEERQMTVMEAIKARKSIRKYKSKPIEPEKLEQVLEAGRLAPSARNEQTWKFLVTENAEQRAAVTAACGQEFVGEAPVILTVCTANQRMMRCGQPACTIDASIAMSFMILEAAEQGLGTCWIGSFDEPQVRAALRIPEEYQIVALTPMGYPAEDPAPRPRKEMQEILVKDSFAD